MAHLPITNKRRRQMRNFQILSSMVMTFTVVFMMWTLLYLYTKKPSLFEDDESETEDEEDDESEELSDSEGDESEAEGDEIEYIATVTQTDEVVYGRDGATDNVVEGFGQVTQEVVEEVDEVNLTNYDEESSLGTRASSTSVRNSKKRMKASPITKNPSKKMKSDAEFQQLTRKFEDFVEGFAANFETISTIMKNEDEREK